MSEKIIKFSALILFAFCLGMMASCQSSSESSLESAESLGIAISPASPQFGQTATLSATTQFPFVAYQWTVTSPSGLISNGGQSNLPLTLQEIGTYQIQLQATKSSGDTLTATQTITSGSTTTTSLVTLHLIADLYQAGVQVATVATDSSTEGDPIVEIGPIVLDFSRSYSSDSTQPFSSFTFKIDWGSGPQTITNPATNTFGSSHAYPISLTMTDTAGDTVITAFTLYVKCPPGTSLSTALQVTLDPSAVSTTKGSGPALNGVYYYSPNYITGGVPPYYVRWDFDGDGILDSPWEPSSNSPLEAYSYWEGQRMLTLQAMDSCFNTASDTASVNLPTADPAYLLPPNSNLLTSGPNYFYLDMNVVSTDPTSLPHNGHFLASANRPRGTTSQFFTAFYSKAGWGTDPNHYRNGNTASLVLSAQDSPPAFAGLPGNSTHGLTMAIVNIPDQFGSNLSPTMGGPGSYVGWGGFTDDVRGDTTTNSTGYGMQYTCSVSNIQVTLLTPIGSTTCDQLPATQNLTYSVRVSGNFQCPNLTSTEFPDEISLNSGSFFTEIDDITACGPLPVNCKPGVVCYIIPH
jgi:hypothetical protein